MKRLNPLPSPEIGICGTCGHPGGILSHDGYGYYFECPDCREYFRNEFGIAAEVLQ